MTRPGAGGAAGRLTVLLLVGGVAAVGAAGPSAGGASAPTASAAATATVVVTPAPEDEADPPPASRPPAEVVPSAPTPQATASRTPLAPSEVTPTAVTSSAAPAASAPAPVRGPTAPALTGSTIPVGSVVLALVVLLGTAALVHRTLRPGRTARTGAPTAEPLPDPVQEAPRHVVVSPGDRAAGDPATLTFLLVLGEALIDAGAALQHVGSTLRDVAAVNGIDDVGVVVLPTALFLSVPHGAGVQTDVTSAGTARLRLDQTDELFRVVSAARRGELDPTAGLAAVQRVRSLPPPFGSGLQVLGYVLFALGLALILRGNRLDLAVASALGVLVGALHMAASRWRGNVQALLPVGAALLVSVVVFSVARALPELSVLPPLVAPLVVLLPGALLTTAVFELATGDIVAGSGRLAAGALRLVLLALGILAGAQLVGVPAAAIGDPTYGPIGLAAPWLGVAVYAVGVMLFVGARPSSLPWILLVLYVAYAGQVLGGLVFGAGLSAFFGALAMTPVAMVAARSQTGPPALVSFSPSFWLLVPGAVGLEGVTRFLDEDRIEGISSLVTMGTSMVGIALGVLLGLAIGTEVTVRLGGEPEPGSGRSPHG